MRSYFYILPLAKNNHLDNEDVLRFFLKHHFHVKTLVPAVYGICEPNASCWLNPVQTAFRNNPETKALAIAA